MLSELHVTTTTGDANNIARVKNYFQYLNVIATVSHACLCAMATRLFTYSIDQKVDYGPGTFKQSSNDSHSTRNSPFFSTGKTESWIKRRYGPIIYVAWPKINSNQLHQC